MLLAFILLVPDYRKTNTSTHPTANMSEHSNDIIIDQSVIRKNNIEIGDYRIEYARSDRAKCQLSDNGIQFGELRVGLAYRGRHERIMHKWYKWAEFKNSLFVSDLLHVQFIEGIEKLKQEDIDDILNYCSTEFAKVKEVVGSLPADELYIAPPEKKRMISLAQYGLSGGIKGIPRKALQKSFNDRETNPSEFLYHQLRINKKKVLDFMVKNLIDKVCGNKKLSPILTDQVVKTISKKICVKAMGRLLSQCSFYSELKDKDMLDDDVDGCGICIVVRMRLLDYLEDAVRRKVVRIGDPPRKLSKDPRTGKFIKPPIEEHSPPNDTEITRSSSDRDSLSPSSPTVVEVQRSKMRSLRTSSDRESISSSSPTVVKVGGSKKRSLRSSIRAIKKRKIN